MIGIAIALMRQSGGGHFTPPPEPPEGMNEWITPLIWMNDYT